MSKPKIIEGAQDGPLEITAAVSGSQAVQLQQVLPVSGGTMSGNIAMGGNKLTGLGAGTANGDSVRYEQLKAHSVRTFVVGAATAPASLGGTARFWSLNGYVGDPTNSETNARNKLYDLDCVAKNMRVYVPSNTRNGTTTVSFRDDGADALTVSIPASTTGAFENTGSSSTIAAGSLCNFRASAAGSSGLCDIMNIQVDVVAV